MQGHLRKSPLVVEIKTTCAHCGEVMELVVDNELNCQTVKDGSTPLIFEPDVDWSEFKYPTIIDGY